MHMLGSAACHGGAKKLIRWQKRFMDHRVRDKEDYLQHLEYMRLNPYGSAAFHGGASIGK